MIRRSEADVVTVRLDVPQERLSELVRHLSPDERERAMRRVRERDRRRAIAARGLLREMLGQRLGAPPGAIAFAYGEHGKPALAEPLARSGWRFNVAHCGPVAVYAFSRSGEVGVDVEAVHDFPESDVFAERFFSSHEHAAYRALRPEEKALGFFHCWTRKEAFVKALGEGLAVPFDAFDVSLAPGAPARLLRIDRDYGDVSAWALESFVPASGFVAALASRA